MLARLVIAVIPLLEHCCTSQHCRPYAIAHLQTVQKDHLKAEQGFRCARLGPILPLIRN